jgi:hypothetical protein
VPGPTLTFGFVIATLIGAGFHLVLGGDARRLAMFLIAGWIGFALGQLVGDIVGFEIVLGFLDVGPLHTAAAVLGAGAAAIFTHVVIPGNRRSK